MELEEIGQRAAAAARALAGTPGTARAKALGAMAGALQDSAASLLKTNKDDVEAAKQSGLSGALADRLVLNESRLDSMASGLGAVAAQPDPVGEVIESWTRPNGLEIKKVRVPIGVVAVIYEARPNVTADVAGLCLMSANAVVLRGSSHALNTNMAIVEVLRAAISSAGLPEDAVQLVTDTSREAATALMKLKDHIDLLIPRGGPALIQSIYDNATVPYIVDGDGNCHVYVDENADPGMATEIVVNAKTQRPGVCNAAETLLVHKKLAPSWLPGLLDELKSRSVEVRGDQTVCDLWPGAVKATEKDWSTEYLDLVLAVKVVDSIDEAIDHVNKYGTSNAEAIVTSNDAAAKRFAAEVDSGSIFVNASTRFSDGGQFGFGSEIGISTQKLHARGPMGLKELTTFKYVVSGDGQVRT